MRFTMPLAAAAIAAAMMFSAAKPVQGQNSKEMNILQRDLYEIRDLVTKSKTAQDEKSGELLTLIKQLMDANTKLSADLRGTQDKLIASQTDQAKSVTGPISDVKKQIEDLSDLVDEFRSNQTKQGQNQEKMSGQVENLEKGMQAILRQLDTLKAPEPVKIGPTPEQAAQLAFAAAQGQRVTNKPELALPAFVDLANTYPTSPYAPMAWLEVGSLYSNAERNKEALDAFDNVLERFGENPVKGPAHLRKAEVLEKIGEKEAAAREYDVYADENPGEMGTAAKARAKELRKPPPAPAPTKSNNKAKNPKKK